MAARKCKDLSPLFFFLGLTNLPSVPSWPILCLVCAFPLVQEFSFCCLFHRPDWVYAKVPPAISAPETTASVLLYKFEGKGRKHKLRFMMIIYSPIKKEKEQAVLLDQHTFLKTKGCARALSVATIEAMPLLLLFDQLYTGKLERFSCKGTWMIKETSVDRIWSCEDGKYDYCITLQCTVWRHCSGNKLPSVTKAKI